MLSALVVSACLAQTKVIYNEHRGFAAMRANAELCLREAADLRESDAQSDRSLYVMAWLDQLTFSSPGAAGVVIAREVLPYAESHLRPATETFEVLSDVAFYVAEVSPSREPYRLARESYRLIPQPSIEQTRDMARAAQLYRDWKTARELEADMPPVLVDGPWGSRNLWAYDVAPQGFRARRVSFLRGSHIIMVGGCHFAIDATRKLAADADIRAAMRAFGFVVTPPDFDNVDSLLSYAREFPEFVPHSALNPPAWFAHGYDLQSVPMFYFVRDGRLIFEISGDDANVVKYFKEGIALLK